MKFKITKHLLNNVSNSNSKLLRASEIRQTLVIQKLQVNFAAQKCDTVH